MDDILSKIPPGSVTSILVVSSLPGNGFWPIILPENARSAGDFSTLPASDSLCTINFYRLCFNTLKGARTSRQRPRRARGRSAPRGFRRREFAFTVEGGARKRVFEPAVLPRDAPGADHAMQARMEAVFQPAIPAPRPPSPRPCSRDRSPPLSTPGPIATPPEAPPSSAAPLRWAKPRARLLEWRRLSVPLQAPLGAFRSTSA